MGLPWQCLFLVSKRCHQTEICCVSSTNPVLPSGGDREVREQSLIGNDVVMDVLDGSIIDVSLH